MKKISLLIIVLIIIGHYSVAQKTNNNTDTSSTKNKELNFEHRDDAKDSITVTYRYLDSIRSIRIDSSINDFYNYFTIPSTQQYLGNNGSAGYSLIYSPILKPGWDAGFHAFDAYQYTLDNTKFYKTTKPFSQADYQLATGKEQTIHALYTNNLRRNLNVGFEYKLISAPGMFVTQNTNHNSYRLFSNYQGKRKRYALYFAWVGNSIKSSENGGIQSDSFLSNPYYTQRFTIPVNLGGSVYYQPSPFNVTVSTGNIYTNSTLFLRQSYDIGKKDSIEINDSTTEYLFYPKLRLQYTFTYKTENYRFLDQNSDSAVYADWYNIYLASSVATDTISIINQWRILKNDFSLIQFPDTKNQAQFLLAGVRLENISGSAYNVFNSDTGFSVTGHYYNIVLHGEYRNKTRNKKWDIQANGELYANGLNSGDYSIYGTLARYLNKKWGNLRLGFYNANRSQSFVYNPDYSFNQGTTTNYAKENITLVQASADNPLFHLDVKNYLINNLAYFKDYYHTSLYVKPINILQLSGSKRFRLSRHWFWYADITFQQAGSSSPVQVPLVFTRNRLAYEGVFFKNLNLCTGIDMRYYSPYQESNYSPLMGQFMPQDSIAIRNRPDVSAFLHFRIKSFTGFLRAENLNAVSFTNGFGFTKNNFGAPFYPYPGFIFRFGIRWWFVN
jgi:hypothetical protein